MGFPMGLYNRMRQSNEVAIPHRSDEDVNKEKERENHHLAAVVNLHTVQDKQEPKSLSSPSYYCLWPLISDLFPENMATSSSTTVMAGIWVLANLGLCGD